jgi:hypothetical protein
MVALAPRRCAALGTAPPARLTSALMPALVRLWRRLDHPPHGAREPLPGIGLDLDILGSERRLAPLVVVAGGGHAREMTPPGGRRKPLYAPGVAR